MHGWSPMVLASKSKQSAEATTNGFHLHFQAHTKTDSPCTHVHERRMGKDVLYLKGIIYGPQDTNVGDRGL